LAQLGFGCGNAFPPRRENPAERTRFVRFEDRHPAGVYSSMPLAVLLIAAAQFLLHWSVAGRYGYFRDELYYIACSRHLAWGWAKVKNRD
jgi:hypothetical protein